MGETELFSGGCYDGRRRSADAELWRPCEPDVARGNRGGVGSVALQQMASGFYQFDRLQAFEFLLGRGRDQMIVAVFDLWDSNA